MPVESASLPTVDEDGRRPPGLAELPFAALGLAVEVTEAGGRLVRGAVDLTRAAGHRIGLDQVARGARAALDQTSSHLVQTGRSSVEHRRAALGDAARGVIGEVVDLVVGQLDVQGIVDRVDIDGIVGRVDIDGIVGRVDIDGIIRRVDIDGIVAEVDLNALIERLDLAGVIGNLDLEALVDALLEQVDVADLLGAVLERIDIPAVLDSVGEHVDVPALIHSVNLNPIVDAALDQVDIDNVLERLELPELIAEQSSDVASRVVTSTRSRALTADDAVGRLVGRLLGRRPALAPAAELESGAARESGAERADR